MQNRIRPLYFYILSFCIPVFLLTGVYIAHRVYPFGGKAILMGDQFTQYMTFYGYLYDILHGDGSILYTWKAGMGLTFLGTFTYYLASPISIFILFFDKASIPEAFMVMTLIKVGLCGLFMYMYLRNFHRHITLTNIMFSTTYSLISFVTGYFFNIMWLDSIYLLPLALLAIEHLIQRQKYLFFTSVLAVLFISNFYMGYITGIFLFLYFVIRCILLDVKLKDSIKKFGYFIGCAAVGGGISAFLTLPTYMILKQNNSKTPFEITSDFTLGFFDFFLKIYNGGTNILDHPNVFSGLLTILLFPIFFVSTKVKPKEKIVYFLLLFFLLMSFQVYSLNVAWHAFEAPMGYSHRFAFVFSFVLIYLAYRVYLIFDARYMSYLTKIYIIHIALIMLLSKLSPETMTIKKALINISLLTAFYLLLYAKATMIKYTKLISLFLLVLIGIDMSANAYNHIKTLNRKTDFYNARTDFDTQSPTLINMIQDIQKKDPDLYRMNSTLPFYLNDSLKYNFRGMSNFNTLSNGKLHDFMNEIGYSTTLGFRSLAQNKGILTSDALFGFRYLTTDKPLNKYGYDKVKCEEEYCLYKNKNALSLGFMINKSQVEFGKIGDMPFEKQNILLGNPDEKISYFQKAKPESVIYQNLKSTIKKGEENLTKIDPLQKAYIEYTFDVKGKKQFYSLLSVGSTIAAYNQMKVYVDKKSLGSYPDIHNDRILDFGAFEDKKVVVRVEILSTSAVLEKDYFYLLDINAFENRIADMKKQELRIMKWKDTAIKGEIDVTKADTLFLSIPYDKGWMATVDGKRVAIEKMGGFIGLSLEKGKHEIELSYMPKGLLIGIGISLTTVVSLIVLTIWNRKRNLIRQR